MVRARCGEDDWWLSRLASAAGHDGEELLVRIGPSWAAGLFAREVKVWLGPCRERGHSLVVPIEWKAVAYPALFPVLTGDLELFPLSPERCRVVLFASYVPPLGELGRDLDRMLLHRVAESTVRSFLHQLSLGIEDART